MGVAKPKPRTLSPPILPARDNQREIYIAQLNQMSNYPFTKELLELYDFGMTDFNENLRAINQAKGNLDYASNLLLDCAKTEELTVDAYMTMVQKVKYPKMRQDLELLYKLKFTNFEENLNAISLAKGDVEVARKSLV
jgi:hypothetical protein